MQRIFKNLSYLYSGQFMPRGILCFATNAPDSIDISQLNKCQNKEWSIKGVVLKKENIRSWNNTRSEGKAFNFVMLDDTSDVKVVAFNQQVDKLYDLIKVNKSYVLTNGIIKPTDPRFNVTKCDHEIILNESSEITQIKEDNFYIPVMKYNFIDFAHLKNCNMDCFVDVVGVAHEIKDVTTVVTRKNDKEIKKRDIILVDSTGSSALLTLWGEDTNMVNNLEHPVIVVRGATVRDFNGRSLSVGFSSIIKINPDNVLEAKLLSKWYETGGCDTTFTSQFVPQRASIESKKVTISEVECTSEDKSDFYTVEAVVREIKSENIFYKACGKCKKKLIDHNNGLYSCISCDTEGPEFKYQLLLNVKISDSTGVFWMTVFHQNALKLLKVSLEEIDKILQKEKNEEILNLLDNALYKKILCTVKVNNETYNDEKRMRAVLYDLSAINNEPV